MFNRLPTDLLDDFIQRYVKLSSLLRLRQTCRFFRDRLSVQNSILRKLAGIHTHLIPSPSVIAERTKSGNNNTDPTVNIYVTKDNIKVGCQLMICFEITNHEVIQRFLNLQDLRDFIVNLVTCGVARAIQSDTVMYFMHEANRQHLLDSVKESVSNDFSEYDIKILRLRFELVKLVDIEHTKMISMKIK